MAYEKNGTIHLTGEDARIFAGLLYHPSPEEIERSDRIFQRIEETVRITGRHENGFTVEVKDLDLSFLDNA